MMTLLLQCCQHVAHDLPPVQSQVISESMIIFGYWGEDDAFAEAWQRLASLA